ncbi:MAG: sulfatase family protein, partial [bacterium]
MIRILVFLLAFGYSFSSSERPANVLLFTIDSCRADRFGLYGHKNNTTPNIDEWSNTATVFTNAYSTSAWTAPGLVSIVTGLYPPVHGVNNRDRMGSPNLITLPKLFKRRGYRVPNLNFFTFAPYYRNLGLGKVEREYFGRQAEAPYLNWLKRNLKGPEEPPFFLWFHVTTVHQPYRTDPEKLHSILGGKEPSQGIHSVMNGAIVPYGSTSFEETDRPILEALYDEEMSRVDRFFGEVLRLLTKANQLETTLIVMTADHGEELLDHGFVGHASTSLRARLYEEILHIPLIVSWPGRVAEGKVEHNLVSQVDILPTISHLLGWESIGFHQGENLFKAPDDRQLFFESVVAGNQTTREKEHIWVRGVRHGRYKFQASGELFDLANDPQETTDIAAEEPGVAKDMAKSLDSWLKEAERLRSELFPPYQNVVRRKSSKCPRIHTPGNNSVLEYDRHTGALLFGWTGDMETT